MKKYTFYNDPGHAWLKVSKKELEKLGLIEKISSFSYERGEFAYLEEDCDASVFLKAKRDAGESFEIVERQ